MSERYRLVQKFVSFVVAVTLPACSSSFNNEGKSKPTPPFSGPHTFEVFNCTNEPLRIRVGHEGVNYGPYHLHTLIISPRTFIGKPERCSKTTLLIENSTTVAISICGKLEGPCENDPYLNQRIEICPSKHPEAENGWFSETICPRDEQHN